ncbi:uncharacterized protein LOC127728329 [Mytilus californianus]|uniref:uncharacterized protein LOC127728329 n=1 Tax=Mytilus californianus TaxID=6549 RepID=UPI002245C03F|nr:uncharacterized protein LOC127728329 [Mytilus californianus]
MISLLVFVVAYVVDESACLKGLKVCRNILTERYYCCSGYEEVNNVCIECKIGYASIEGQSCMPCNEDRFGKRCLNRCECVSWQRCDNVKGCVPGVGTAFNTTAGNENIANVTDVSIESSMETTTGFSKEHLLIYSLVATSMIFAVGTCFVCRRLQKKRARREETANETNSTPIQITKSGNNTFISIEENYLMKNTFTHESMNPVIETEESKSPDKQETDTDEDSNLHPYNSILKPETNVGQGERSQKPFQTFRESLAESTENITNHLDHYTED